MLEANVNPSIDGYFLIVATASVAPDLADYTAHFNASVDLGDDIATRYVRVSDDIDMSLALTDLVPVDAGSHTIRLHGGRFDTTPDADLRVPGATLSVMFFPKEMVAIFGDGFESESTNLWSAVAN
jgi:hypothetical protein